MLLIALLMTGCASIKNNGKISSSADVGKAFQTATVVPGHTYYYTGPEAQPTVIIGINESYSLLNAKNFWIQVDNPKKALEDWNLTRNSSYEIKYRNRGANILTPDGEKVGIWYSRYTHTSVKFPDAKTVVIYTPDLTTNDPLDPKRNSSR